MAVPGDQYKHKFITDSVYTVRAIRDGEITLVGPKGEVLVMTVADFNKNYKKV